MMMMREIKKEREREMDLKRSVMFQLPLRQFSLLLLSERDIIRLFPRQTFSKIGGTLHVCSSGTCISYLDDMMMMMMMMIMRQVKHARQNLTCSKKKKKKRREVFFFVIQTT